MLLLVPESLFVCLFFFFFSIFAFKRVIGVKVLKKSRGSKANDVDLVDYNWQE